MSMSPIRPAPQPSMATAAPVSFRKSTESVLRKVPEGALNWMLVLCIAFGSTVVGVNASTASEPTSWNSPATDVAAEKPAGVPGESAEPIPSDTAPRDWGYRNTAQPESGDWTEPAPDTRDWIPGAEWAPGTWNSDGEQSRHMNLPNSSINTWTWSWSWLWVGLTGPILALVVLIARLHDRWVLGVAPAPYWTCLGLVACVLVFSVAWTSWTAWWPTVSGWVAAPFGWLTGSWN